MPSDKFDDKGKTIPLHSLSPTDPEALKPELDLLDFRSDINLAAQHEELKIVNRSNEQGFGRRVRISYFPDKFSEKFSGKLSTCSIQLVNPRQGINLKDQPISYGAPIGEEIKKSVQEKQKDILTFIEFSTARYDITGAAYLFYTTNEKPVTNPHKQIHLRIVDAMIKKSYTASVADQTKYTFEFGKGDEPNVHQRSVEILITKKHFLRKDPSGKDVYSELEEFKYERKFEKDEELLNREQIILEFIYNISNIVAQ